MIVSYIHTLLCALLAYSIFRTLVFSTTVAHGTNRKAIRRAGNHTYPHCRCCTKEKTTVKEIMDGIQSQKDNPTGTIVVLVDGIFRDDVELYVADGSTNSAKDPIQRRIRKVKW